MMNHTQQAFHPQQDALDEQAATWFLRMQERGCSDAERRAFEAWLDESEVHRNEYQQYVLLWRSLDQLEREPRRKPRRKARAVITMLAFAAIITGTAQWYFSRGETYITAVGEQRHIVLADGTAVDLNTASKIRVKLSEHARKITLLQGEALFNVAHDGARPFEVTAGNGVLRDIGTAFNVAAEEDNIAVAVLEGEVQVSLDGAASVNLHGGQQLKYSAHDMQAVSAFNAADVTAWREGRLIFRDTPLAEAIRQINRYHQRPIKLSGSGLNDLKVSGEFNANDREGLLRALKMLFALDSKDGGETTMLTPASAR